MLLGGHIPQNCTALHKIKIWTPSMDVDSCLLHTWNFDVASIHAAQVYLNDEGGDQPFVVVAKVERIRPILDIIILKVSTL